MIPGLVTTEYTEHTENRFCTGGNGGNGEPNQAAGARFSKSEDMSRTQFDKLTWEHGGSGIPILRSLCVLL